MSPFKNVFNCKVSTLIHPCTSWVPLCSIWTDCSFEHLAVFMYWRVILFFRIRFLAWEFSLLVSCCLSLKSILRVCSQVGVWEVKVVRPLISEMCWFYIIMSESLNRCGNTAYSIFPNTIPIFLKKTVSAIFEVVLFSF